MMTVGYVSIILKQNLADISVFFKIELLHLLI